MEKARIIELLARKMAGEITEKETIELDQLIADYPDSVYYEEFLKQLWEEKTPKSNSEEAYEKLLNKYSDDFDLPHEEKIINKREKAYKNILLALSVVCIVIIALGGYFSSKSFLIGDDGLNSAEIISGKGVRKKIVLPDGTQVWLNSDSRLTYELGMNKSKQRLVTLSGEAYFDVTHNKNKPFIIHTNKIAVRVLGTAFNISAYPNDKKSETTLVRGSIQLSVNSNPEQKILLKPSEKFALVENKKDKSNKSNPEVTLLINHIEPVTIASQTYVQETSWTENKLVFQNESMEELIPKLERWFNVTINIQNKAVGSYHFTGIFKNESITVALTAMQLTKNFNFKPTNNGITIY